MRRWLALLALAPLTMAAGGGTIIPVYAAGPAIPGFTCSGTGPWVCSGLIPSFDGVPLDTDVTIPTDGVSSTGQLLARPLLVMMHGYGSNKTEWESSTVSTSDPQTDGYNTASFAARGYAVLTYTARGFAGSCGKGPFTPGAANGDCDSGWTHLADRRFEVRDTQYLAGLLADAGVADPQKIAVTGLSYGGGQSLLLAMQGDSVATVPNAKDPSTYDAATNQPWTSPKGLAMHLVAAVPRYPWSDLVDSLLPNGRASDGVILSDGDRAHPPGIEKQSYVSYLFFSGAGAGYYCPMPCADPSANLNGWFADVSKGEPYLASDPVLAQALDQLSTWKSAYYQDALIARTSDQVPIFDIQGWTDNLFPQVEGLSLVNKLRAHGWPVKVAVADVGHPDAQNTSAAWSVVNSQANAFLDHYMLGTAAVSLDSSAQVTTCNGSAGTIYRKMNWTSLAPHRVTFSSTAPKATTSAVPSDSLEASTDPIAVAAQHNSNGACITVPAATTVPTAAWDFPITTPFTLLGEPAMHLDGNIAGTDAEVNALLWDVAPDGTKTLVTRGAYRYTGSPGLASVDTPLQGNGWNFASGHMIRLEVTQDDAPYLRPDDLPSAITYTSVTLTLPTPTPAGAAPNPVNASAEVTLLAATGGGR